MQASSTQNSTYTKSLALVFGGSGALGDAFSNHFSLNPYMEVHVFSRKKLEFENQNIKAYQVDYENEPSLEDLAKFFKSQGNVRRIIVATGALHNEVLQPEKSLKQLSIESLKTSFSVNTIVPIIIAKHFAPLLDKKEKSIFAALSARVGSIEDNHLGGWFSYRSSKAALNMLIKTMAIEFSRSHPKAIITGLHPGTVDSRLSKPFQKHVPAERLFDPDYSVEKLVNVMENLNTEDSGGLFAWDGKRIPF